MEQMPRFGTDGWRAVIGDDFTFSNVRLVTQAVADSFSPQRGERVGVRGGKQKVFVGYDNRFLAECFAEESAKVLQSNGYRAHLLPSAVTSPLLSFATWNSKSPFGVMITASHNPYQYLGFKVKGSFGGSISPSTVAIIEKNLERIWKNQRIARKGMSLPPLRSSDNVIPQYFNYLHRHFDPSIFRRNNISLVFDSMYGPAGRIVQAFLKPYIKKIDLQVIHNHRDAFFGGLHPEPIEEFLSDLKRTVRKSRSLAGFALDGDGDRLGVVDEKGRYLTPHEIFSLLLHYLASEKNLKGKVVQAVSLGTVSQRIAQSFNLPFEEVPVGFKHITERLLKDDVLMGGEESGGFAYGKVNSETKRGSLLPERDGFFNALLFMEMIFQTRRNVSALLKEIGSTYGAFYFMRKDIHLESPIADKTAFVKKVQNFFPSRWMGKKVREMRSLDGLKVVFEDDSWLLIRPSGTEPLLRTYAEFPSRSVSSLSLAKLSKLLYNVLNK